jgi:hypothetical protein
MRAVVVEAEDVRAVLAALAALDGECARLRVEVAALAALLANA